MQVLDESIFAIPPVLCVKTSPTAPEQGGALPVPAGNPDVPEILFEHSGWGLYTDDGPDIKTTARGEGNILTHIGCDCDFFNWHMAIYVWPKYEPDGNYRFRCVECGEVCPLAAYEFFCKAFNLVNL